MRETRKHWQWCGVVCGVSQIRCWRSVQNLLSSLIVINLQTKIWKCNGCETWSVTLNEERSLRVLREVFGPKREEMLNEELHDVCCSLSIIRMVGWAVHVARMGGEERCKPGLGGKPERRRLLGRPYCKWRIILRLS